MQLILQRELMTLNYFYRIDDEFCLVIYVCLPRSPWQMFLRWPYGLGVCFHETAFLCKK